MKILLLPVAKFNRKIVDEISLQTDLEIKYHKYLKKTSEFQQMFNEGSLDLDRTYIVFINDNQI